MLLYNYCGYAEKRAWSISEDDRTEAVAVSPDSVLRQIQPQSIESLNSHMYRKMKLSPPNFSENSFCNCEHVDQTSEYILQQCQLYDAQRSHYCHRETTFQTKLYGAHPERTVQFNSLWPYSQEFEGVTVRLAHVALQDLHISIVLADKYVIIFSGNGKKVLGQENNHAWTIRKDLMGNSETWVKNCSTYPSSSLHVYRHDWKSVPQIGVIIRLKYVCLQLHMYVIYV